MSLNISANIKNIAASLQILKIRGLNFSRLCGDTSFIRCEKDTPIFCNKKLPVMKKVLSFSLLTIISLVSYSFILKKKAAVYGIDKIEKNWGMVTPNLFASKYETTNKEYQVFLNTIKPNLNEEALDRVRVHIENWNEECHFNEPMVNNYYQHPSYADYPLVNINHEGAKAYCVWLTEMYHKRPKRKYKKVKFRLPTEKEWVTAAKAGRNGLFPWGGYYTRNGKGEFLANFNAIPDTAIKRNAKTGTIEIKEEALNNFKVDLIDVSAFPAPVQQYHANDFGLYQMSGNVAEMLDEAGRTKGGSWASSGYYIRIDAEDEFAGVTQPDRRIGFRYFVEVLEE